MGSVPRMPVSDAHWEASHQKHQSAFGIGSTADIGRGTRNLTQRNQRMPVPPLQTSQPTPPGKRHTVGSVLTNDGQQMRRDKVNQAARRHRRKRRRSRKSKRRYYSTTRQDASVSNNVCEEKFKNGQPTPDNVFPTVPSALINITAAGISSLGFGDQYAAVTHNIHEEKMNNGQPAPHTVFSTAPPVLDATVTLNVHEQKMENGQPQTDKVLSTVPLCLGHMTAAGIPSMSIRDLCMSFN
ncbi:uncharacterized protein LOC144581107 [Callithrix jacchus]